jgi:hypothetical protein
MIVQLEFTSYETLHAQLLAAPKHYVANQKNLRIVFAWSDHYRDYLALENSLSNITV